MKPCYLAPILLLASCQSLENRLVFHPVTVKQTASAPPPSPLEDVELRTADGIKLHARWCPHPNAQGVVLYCHGNSGNLDYFGKLMRDLWTELNRSVLIFDYPGYGRSEGKPSEAGCYAAADAAFDWLVRVRGVAPENIVIAGESLGGGVAVELASRRPHEGLVLIRTFTSVPDVARQSFVLSSAPAIMHNRFDSLKRIPNCRSPIFFAQADKDRLMPFEHAEKLRQASVVATHLHVLPGLDHNDPLPPEFFRDLKGFLDRSRTKKGA